MMLDFTVLLGDRANVVLIKVLGEKMPVSDGTGSMKIPAMWKRCPAVYLNFTCCWRLMYACHTPRSNASITSMLMPFDQTYQHTWWAHFRFYYVCCFVACNCIACTSSSGLKVTHLCHSPWCSSWKVNLRSSETCPKNYMLQCCCLLKGCPKNVAPLHELWIHDASLECEGWDWAILQRGDVATNNSLHAFTQNMYRSESWACILK